MTAQVIPLAAVPHQLIKVRIGQSTAAITIRTRDYGLFADVSLDDVVLVTGVECQDRNWIVRDAYLGFPGDLTFVDTEGTSDPTYDGLGTRFLLFYNPS